MIMRKFLRWFFCGPDPLPVTTIVTKEVPVFIEPSKYEDKVTEFREKFRELQILEMSLRSMSLIVTYKDKRDRSNQLMIGYSGMTSLQDYYIREIGGNHRVYWTL